MVCEAFTQSFDNDHPLTLGVEREGVFHSSGRYDDLALWNRLLTVEEKQALQTSGPWFSGCTDELACNYNPDALLDNGTCASCETLQTACLQGTVWSAALGVCGGQSIGRRFRRLRGHPRFLGAPLQLRLGVRPLVLWRPLGISRLRLRDGADWGAVLVAENLGLPISKWGVDSSKLTHDEWTSSAEPACAIYGAGLSMPGRAHKWSLLRTPRREFD